jgi:hypothetical protein
MEGTIVASGGVILLTLVIGYTFYSVWRKYLIFVSSSISREIQGLGEIPRPPLKDLVNLVKFLIEKRSEILHTVEKKESEDKYDNTYQ